MLLVAQGLGERGYGQDAEPYVLVSPGTLPIILTAPHGGSVQPKSSRTRRFGLLSPDTYTAELTAVIADELKNQFGGGPHVVVCLLHRTKVDCNRDMAEGAQGDPLATATWHRYHDSITAMRKEISDKHGAGLLLDVHGHRHAEGFVELGYLLTGSQLSVTDALLDADPRFAAATSIRELDRRSPASFSGLLRGRESLGGLLEVQGIRCLPSPARPSPGKAAYFSGVYDITAHGSRDGGTISAIQLECPWEGIRDTPANQRRFARVLAVSLGRYFEFHFGKRLGAGRN